MKNTEANQDLNIMTKEEFEKLQDLEQQAIDALRDGCWGYDCIEYDNGTFECDDCPCYKMYSELMNKADNMLNK